MRWFRWLHLDEAGIEPYVHSLYQVARHRHVIVVDEDDASPEGWILAQLRNLADEFLTCIIMGMGFTGEDQLQWTLGIQQHSFQARKIAQN
jgi:hypothetical protein